jgi:uncharacterized protein (TIGR03905 family)
MVTSYDYKTSGTCSRNIKIELEGDVVKSVEFVGGCNGNTKGIGAIVAGMKVDDVIKKLKGIKCGMRPTSCPDQLALALEIAKNRGENSDAGLDESDGEQ